MIQKRSSEKSQPELIRTPDYPATAVNLIKKGFIDWNDDQVPVPSIILKIKMLIGLEDEFIFNQLPTMSDVNKSKIMAILCCYEKNDPWEDYFLFEKVGESFNNRLPRVDDQIPLSIGECAWTFNCMKGIKDLPLSRDIRKYIAACAHNQELLLMPEIFSFLQSDLEEMTEITDVTEIKMAYISKKNTGNELVDAQLQKLLSVDSYLYANAKI